jgi:hypothetical protein
MVMLRFEIAELKKLKEIAELDYERPLSNLMRVVIKRWMRGELYVPATVEARKALQVKP